MADRDEETTPCEDSAFQMLCRHSDNPSAFVGLNEANLRFSVPDIDGLIFYRRTGRSWIQFGGPVSAAEDKTRLFTEFRRAAERNNRRVIAVQVQTEDAKLYSDAGWSVDQLGASYAVELADMHLKGKKFVSLRNKISRARRAGLEVVVADSEQHREAIRAIDDAWLHSKGKHAKELQFLIGELGGPMQPQRRLYLGLIEGKPVGYLSFAPAYGTRPGWLHDLSRRLPDAPPGVMEALNSTACKDFLDDGARWLHFGFTPFTGLQQDNALPGANHLVTKAIELLAEHGDRIYPAKSQLEYKLKWNPSVVLPEYVAYPGRPSIRAVWDLLRLTRAI